MKVSELISELERMPKDADVFTLDEHGVFKLVKVDLMSATDPDTVVKQNADVVILLFSAEE